MGRKRKVSFSQYKLFKKCELAYRFQYVDKLGEWAPNIHLVFGTAMHDTIQSLLYLLYNKKTFEETDKVNGVNVNDYIIREGGKMVDFDTNRLLKDRMFNEASKIDEKTRKDYITKEDMVGFYEDGIFILDYLKSKRTEWFTINGWELVGIEFPLKKDLKEGLEFVGYIDILLKDANDNFHIIDLKTSTKGWSFYHKKDTVSTNQNLLYKDYLSKELDIPYNKINVEYLVLARKLEGHNASGKRLERFVPPNGIISVKQAVGDFENFVESVFKNDGTRDAEREYKPNPTKFNCTYCDFRKMGICEHVHPDAKNV